MYDLSPAKNFSQDYIQVGIGLRNQFSDIGQIRYDPRFVGYIRAEKTLDSSKISPGFEDQYDATIVVDPNVQPKYPNTTDNGSKVKVDGPDTGNLWWIIVGLVGSLLVLAVITYFLCCKSGQKPQ